MNFLKALWWNGDDFSAANEDSVVKHAFEEFKMVSEMWRTESHFQVTLYFCMSINLSQMTTWITY